MGWLVCCVWRVLGWWYVSFVDWGFGICWECCFCYFVVIGDVWGCLENCWECRLLWVRLEDKVCVRGGYIGWWVLWYVCGLVCVYLSFFGGDYWFWSFGD